MDDPRELLVKIVKILDELQIPYMVTGGLAVFVWGRPRFTADVDIVIGLSEPKIDALAGALQKVEDAGYIDKEAIIKALINEGEFNFISPEMGLKVDFWVIKNKTALKELARRQAKEILNQKVFFISPEDLILSKLRWVAKGGGTHHLEDVKSVVRQSSKLIDYKYLGEKSREQGTSGFLEGVK